MSDPQICFRVRSCFAQGLAHIAAQAYGHHCMAFLDVLVTMISLRLDLRHRWTEQGCGFSGRKPTVSCLIMSQDCLFLGTPATPCPSAHSSQEPVWWWYQWRWTAVGLSHSSAAPVRPSFLWGREPERLGVISCYLQAPALLLCIAAD